MANGSDLAIRAEHLAKRYRVGLKQESYRTLRESLSNGTKRMARAASHLVKGRSFRRRERPDEFWALEDVSIDVAQGDVLGIIGRNGAGKSTLLKILSRITEPTSGEAMIYGRVGSLLEVGTGFHPELTGRENVYLNGSILGMRQCEVAARFDEIIAFAEVDRFIDTPVKRYSSGMYLRLAFSVAAHLEPEILLVDEVLAVGDAAFQQKCLGKMDEVAASGRSVLFVSHNMPAVSSLCTRIVVLDHGKVWADGGRDCISDYLNYLCDSQGAELSSEQGRELDKPCFIRRAWLEDESGRKVDVAICGQPIVICIEYENRGVSRMVDLLAGFYDQQGRRMFGCNSATSFGGERRMMPRTVALAKCRVEKVPLSPGSYRLNFAAYENSKQLDHITSGLELTVEAGDFFGTGRSVTPRISTIMVPHEWHFD